MIYSFSVGKNTISAKRLAEQDPNYEKLLPTTKAKTKSSSQFTLKRKKSKSQFDYDDLLCPFDGGKTSSKWLIPFIEVLDTGTIYLYLCI